MQYKKILPLIGSAIITSTLISGCNINQNQVDLYGPAPIETDWDEPDVEKDETDKETPIEALYGVEVEEEYDTANPEPEVYGPMVEDYEWEEDSTSSSSDSMTIDNDDSSNKNISNDTLGASKNSDDKYLEYTVLREKIEGPKELEPANKENYPIESLYGVKPINENISLDDLVIEDEETPKEVSPVVEKPIETLYGVKPINGSTILPVEEAHEEVGPITLLYGPPVNRSDDFEEIEENFIDKTDPNLLTHALYGPPPRQYDNIIKLPNFSEDN